MKKPGFIFLFLSLLSFTGNSQTIKDSIQSIIYGLENKYEIIIFYNKALPDSIYNPARKYQLAPDTEYVNLLKYVQLFETEFNKYPVEFIHKANLKYVAIVKAITNDNGQARTAVPDRVNEVLYLQYPNESNNLSYYRHVIHHEFYHMIEEEINGSSFYQDPVWELFNSDTVKYGEGGEKWWGTNIDAYEINHPANGFINRYSLSSLQEDKAEIFAILFVEEERKKVENWTKTDKPLERKINFMKNFMYRLSKEWGNFLFEKR